MFSLLNLTSLKSKHTRIFFFFLFALLPPIQFEQTPSEEYTSIILKPLSLESEKHFVFRRSELQARTEQQQQQKKSY